MCARRTRKGEQTNQTKWEDQILVSKLSPAVATQLATMILMSPRYLIGFKIPVFDYSHCYLTFLFLFYFLSYNLVVSICI